MGADPSFPRAHTNLGILLLGRGDREGALDLFQRVVRLEPGNPLARLNLGLVLADLGRFGEARLAYGEALRLNPSLREAKDALGRLPAGRE
jgi:Flp pilus assembly protein TadD